MDQVHAVQDGRGSAGLGASPASLPEPSHQGQVRRRGAVPHPQDCLLLRDFDVMSHVLDLLNKAECTAVVCATRRVSTEWKRMVDRWLANTTHARLVAKRHPPLNIFAPRLKTLLISACHFATASPLTGLRSFAGLTSLTLSAIKTGLSAPSLFSALASAPHLASFTLTHCQLVDVGEATEGLRAWLVSAHALVSVDLSHNHGLLTRAMLSCLCDNMGEGVRSVRLAYAEMNWRAFVDLPLAGAAQAPGVFRRLLAPERSLRSLDLSFNVLCAPALEDLRQAMRTNTSLTALDVSGIGQERESRALCDLCGMLPHCAFLRHLTMSQVASTDATLEAMKSIASSSRTLESFVGTVTTANSAVMHVLADMIRCSLSLTSLSLSSTTPHRANRRHHHHHPAHEAAHAHDQPPPHPHNMLLMGAAVLPEDVQLVTDALEANTTLRTLRLQRLGLGDVGCAMLAQGVAKNKGLHELDVSRNNMDVFGGCGFSDALAYNSTLQTLCVGSQPISVKNVVHPLSLERASVGELAVFAFLLQANTAITRLDLSARCPPQVAQRVCVSLCYNTHLTHLSLASNGLTDSIDLPLALSLHENTSLTHLDLSHNHMWNVRSIVDALRVNTTLRRLDLSDNLLTDSKRAELEVLGRAHPSLREVVV